MSDLLNVESLFTHLLSRMSYCHFIHFFLLDAVREKPCFVAMSPNKLN